MPATLNHAPAPAADEVTQAVDTALTGDAKSAFRETLAAAGLRANAEPPVDETDEAGEADPPPAGDPKATPQAPTTEELADPTQPAAPKLPETPAPAGPTREWIATAIEYGVPRELIRHARDDQQLEEFIVEFGERPEEKPADSAEATAAEIKLAFGEGEYDETDPTHRNMKAVVDTANSIIGELRKELASVRGATLGLVEQRKAEAVIAEEQQFDTVLDTLSLGTRGSAERQAVWPTYKAILQVSPKLSPAEAIKRAAYATHPDILTKQAWDVQLAALKEQQGETLGGGPAKPAPKQEKTSEQNFRELLREKSRKAREAGL